MGWTPLDTLIERTRETVTEDPVAGRQAIAQLLEETGNPSARVRLWGLMVLACHRVGDLEAALRAYEAGRKIRRASVLARAELEGQAAHLHIIRGDRDSARSAVAKAISLIRPLAENPRGESKGARRMARRDRALYGALLIIRAEIARNLEGDPTSLRKALADALEAFRWIDARYDGRVHHSAVSAVSVLVTQVGTPKDVSDVLQLAGEAERLLRRRRVPARHPHCVKLRWVRALACARLGSAEQAERILSTVVTDLLELGLEDDARRAGEHLLWIIADLGGHYGRARDERRRLGLPPEMDPPDPPKLDEVDPPIGF